MIGRLTSGAVAAAMAVAMLAALSAGPAAASDENDRRMKLDMLYERLATAGDDSWERIQNQIYALWFDSGSPTADFLHARARAAMDKEDYDSALVFLDDLVRIAPDFAEGWNARATVHFLRDEYGAAIADIHHTLALEPRHFGALAGLGLILDRIGESKWALDAYRKVQAIHPHLPGAEEGIRSLAPRVDGQNL